MYCHYNLRERGLDARSHIQRRYSNRCQGPVGRKFIYDDWSQDQGLHVSRRILRDEGGFTLPELLVTMVMMIVVLFALYSIFDMSIRVFSFGNDKTEAVENARLGMEKMARE